MIPIMIIHEKKIQKKISKRSLHMSKILAYVRQYIMPIELHNGQSTSLCNACMVLLQGSPNVSEGFF
jgi:aerobic-type carbon monoxide dehydrogenase small subunit (CoxS/CutS family)